jgi:hypothetical protein
MGIALAPPGLLPSSHSTLSAFPLWCPLFPTCGYPFGPQLYIFRGSITQPVSLFHPASDSPYGVCPRTSLLTCWLSFSQVGLSQIYFRITHWVTLTNFMGSLPIPRFRIYLGTIRVEAPVTRRSPHRPVREGFPHTVPRFCFSQKPNRRHPVWRTTLLPYKLV